MTVSPYEAPGELVPSYSAPTDLARWVETAAGVRGIAEALSRTSFVPAALKGRPDEIAAQILYGQDLNMPPMIALMQIHIIEGRPSISALAMRGMAQAAGVRFRYDEQTASRCRMSAMGPGDADWTTVKWDLDRAKQLGLTNKRNWQNQPQAMLIARATSELCRLVAAPLFIGLPYSAEELGDGHTVPSTLGEVEEEAPKKTRTVRREPVKAKATVAQAAKESQQLLRDMDAQQAARTGTPGRPQDDDDTPYWESSKPQDPDPTLMEITDQTRAELPAAFTALELTSREDRLAYVGDVLGRDVSSIADLTEADGQHLLAKLGEDIAELHQARAEAASQ